MIHFNSPQSAVHFTVDLKIDNFLSFLDVNLRRKEGGNVERGVFRKHMWVERYTYFLGSHPIRYKRNLLNCTEYRASNTCSLEMLDEKSRCIIDILVKHGYPDPFVRRFRAAENQRVKSQMLE